MIDKYDIIKCLENNNEVYYDKQYDVIRDKESDLKLCDMDTYIDTLRKRCHCDFKGLYSCPASLLNVLECNKCGTVIFSSDAYEDYDKNLQCPTCSVKETHFDYWTKEDIKSDIKKQNTLNLYKEWRETDEKIYNRHSKTGL